MHKSNHSLLSWRGIELSETENWKFPYADLEQSGRGQDRLFSLIKSYGFAVVTDVPIVGASTSGAVEFFKSHAMDFGCPVSQSAKLDFLGHVTDLGSDISKPTNRGYESSANLPFHSDRCDLLTLLCVRQAPIGGETRIVSALSAYETLAGSAPELAEVLCKPVPFDLRDSASQKPWALMPVFSFENDTFIARYVRRFIEASQRFDDAPRLTDEQMAAFDALDAILEAPGMSMNLRLKPGEWLLIDNHRLLHARTEFKDEEGVSEGRLLLRSWLCWSGSPELPSSYAPTFGRTSAGSYRGGVWPDHNPLKSMPSSILNACKNVEELLA